MGADFISASLDGSLTRPQVRAQFQEWGQEAAYAEGHQYSGSWNMLRGLDFLTKRDSFASREAAETFVTDHAEKWGPGLAVRYRNRRQTRKPTFAGRDISGQTIRAREDGHVVCVADYSRGFETLVPADQLEESDKEAVLSVAARYRIAERASRTAWAALRAVTGRIERLDPVPADEVVAAQQAVRDAEAAHAAATGALNVLTDRLVPTLYAYEDGGEMWLIGGWAAC